MILAVTVPRRHQLPDLPGAGAHGRELRQALASATASGCSGSRNACTRRWSSSTSCARSRPHPDPSKLDRIFEICAYAMGFSVDEMSQMTGPGAVRAHLRVGCLPPDPHDAGGVLGARRAVRARPGRLRGHVRPLLHDRHRDGRQRDPGRCAHAVLPRPRRAADRPTRLSTGSWSRTDGRRAWCWASARCNRARGSTRASGCSPTPGCPRRSGWWGRPRSRGRRPAGGQDAPLEDGPARVARDLVAARPAHRLGLVAAFDPLINEAILVYRAFDSWEGTKRYMVDMLGQRHLEGRGPAHGVHLLRAGRPHERLARGPQRSCAPRSAFPTRCTGWAGPRPGTATSATSCSPLATR